MSKTIIEMIEERHEFVADVDGYVYYAPGGPGLLSPFALRLIAQELDDRNAVWDEQVKLAGRTNINPLFIEGLKLVDRMIVALEQAGFCVARGDDGGDALETINTRKAAIELVASVDDSQLFFQRAGYPHRSVVSVIPSNGVDAICDHSTGDKEFVRVMDSLTVDA